MQINIGSSANTYLNEPCPRCGGRKRVAKKWKEKVKNFIGTTLVEYSQIVCINKICQTAFDKVLLQESKKREGIRITREANALARKASSLSQANKARKKSASSIHS